jgi:hypothetical protein
MQILYIVPIKFNALLTKLIAGLHDAIFLRYKKWHFNANTFNNAENHIKDMHYLNKGGDI